MYTPSSGREALEIYRKLTLIRQCQEAIIREYPKDEIKTPVHLGIGLEGISVGVAHCLAPGTKSFAQLRNHGQYLSITGETDRFFGELYGRVTGVGGGKAGSMHLSAPEHGLITASGIVASTISLAVGAGFAAKYRGSDDIAVAMFGDAAIEEGEYWESLNFACLHGLKVLFVCENNDMAIHTFGADRRGFKSIAGVMKGFDCHVFENDGTDVRNVIGTVQKAIELMQRDSKPAFTCFTWYRFLEHAGPYTDWDAGYRPKPSNEELNALDPVLKYEQFLITQEIDPSQMQKIREEVAAQIEKSMNKAKSAPYPSEEHLLQGVFA
jgi:pyruvate dehydrogenase E1 component alpha subunit